MNSSTSKDHATAVDRASVASEATQAAEDAPILIFKMLQPTFRPSQTARNIHEKARLRIGSDEFPGDYLGDPSL